MSNYYAVLGVTPDSDQEVIDAAYRALIKKYHPDVGAAGVSNRSAEINEAYAVLRDPRKRAEYDSKLGGKRLSNVAPQSSRRNGSEPGSADPSHTKECPDCAERVQRGARVCRYCGYAFHGHADPQSKQVEARPPPRSSIVRPLLAVSGTLFLLWILGLCSITLPPSSDGNADAVPIDQLVQNDNTPNDAPLPGDGPKPVDVGQIGNWNLWHSNLPDKTFCYAVIPLSDGGTFTEAYDVADEAVIFNIHTDVWSFNADLEMLPVGLQFEKQGEPLQRLYKLIGNVYRDDHVLSIKFDKPEIIDTMEKADAVILVSTLTEHKLGRVELPDIYHVTAALKRCSARLAERLPQSQGE